MAVAAGAMSAGYEGSISEDPLSDIMPAAAVNAEEDSSMSELGARLSTDLALALLMIVHKICKRSERIRPWVRSLREAIDLAMAFNVQVPETPQPPDVSAIMGMKAMPWAWQPAEVLRYSRLKTS